MMTMPQQIQPPFSNFDDASHVLDNRLSGSLKQCYSDVSGVWEELLHDFFQTSSGQNLTQFIEQEQTAGAVVYPATPFLALTLTPYEKTKVVILGQDPYHGAGQAQGLAFSVTDGMKIPPSLRNMFKELQRDLQTPVPTHGSLVRWAEQGVLLLNTSLTVRHSEAASHAKKGWEILTDCLIQKIAMKKEPLVFMLWGAHAQKKESIVLEAMQQTGTEHLILKANHPSPLSATKAPVPFIGCGHFGLANEFLKERQLALINW